MSNNIRQDAIDACQECHNICQETLAYHGDEKGARQLSSQHIKRLMAAIELCQVTANMLTIRAPLIDKLCELCAIICEQCATSCEATNINTMKQCAEACKNCAAILYEEGHDIKQAG